jgi:hypothetical protein
VAPEQPPRSDATTPARMKTRCNYGPNDASLFVVLLSACARPSGIRHAADLTALIDNTPRSGKHSGHNAMTKSYRLLKEMVKRTESLRDNRSYERASSPAASSDVMVCQICGLSFNVLNDELAQHHSSEEHLREALARGNELAVASGPPQQQDAARFVFCFQSEYASGLPLTLASRNRMLAPALV